MSKDVPMPATSTTAAAESQDIELPDVAPENQVTEIHFALRAPQQSTWSDFAPKALAPAKKPTEEETQEAREREFDKWKYSWNNSARAGDTAPSALAKKLAADVTEGEHKYTPEERRAVEELARALEQMGQLGDDTTAATDDADADTAEDTLSPIAEDDAYHGDGNQ